MALSDYTDYKPVTSGEAGTIENQLPNEFDAAGVRYRKEIFITVPSSIWGGTLPAYILVGKWKIQILDRPGGIVLFEQEVEWRATIVAFNIGGLVLVTWFPMDNGVGKISTTVINGQVIDPAKAWQNVDLPNISEVSESIAYTDFTPEGAAVLGDYKFFATWYSPPYVCDIPEGAVLNRVFDNWGVGTLDGDALYGFSLRPGNPVFDSLTDPTYAIRMAAPRSWGLQIQHSYGGAGSFEANSMLRGYKNPTIYKEKSNRLWLFAQTGNDYSPFYSTDDGMSWKRAQMPNEQGALENVITWEPGYQHQNGIAHSSGTHISVAVRNSRVCVRSSPDGIDWTAAVQEVARVKRTERYEVLELPNGALRLVNLTGDHVLEASTVGAQWRELP